MWNGKKETWKKPKPKPKRSLIFHVRMRIIQNNAGNPNERDEHAKNLRPTGISGVLLRVDLVYPWPRYIHPIQTTPLVGQQRWLGLGPVAVSIFVLICHFSSFMNIWAGQVGGSHEIFMWLADRSFRVFAEMWWLLVEQIERLGNGYILFAQPAGGISAERYQMAVAIY